MISAYGEQLREQVNSWIQTTHAFDGVIDFAKIMADPYNPLRRLKTMAGIGADVGIRVADQRGAGQAVCSTVRE